MQRLTLIGMPGSGKSAAGKIVAALLGWDFLETDKCIEERQGMPLQELIDQVGDLSFRQLEEQTILTLTFAEHTVISTGGSVIYSDTAMRHLSSISTIVFLDATLEAIRAHINLEAPRGIIGMTEGGLEELYQQRLSYYRRYAELTVSFDSETPEEAANKVLSVLPKQGQSG